MNEIVASLLAFIVQYSDFPAPPAPPVIEFKAAAEFERNACPVRANCAARGYYEDGTGTIVLHEDLRELATIEHRGLVVHELVHYLQDLSGQYKGEQTCVIWRDRERQAFVHQLRYMTREAGHRSLRYLMPHLSIEQCEKAKRRQQR